jgi:hypothetical protein
MHENDPAEEPALVTKRTMEIVVALLFLLASAVVVLGSWRLGVTWLEAEGPAAGYFPFYIGLLMGVASLVNLLTALRHGGGEGAATFVSAPGARKVVAMLVPLTIYVAAIAVAGIYVASALYIGLFMWWFGGYRLITGLLVGAAVSLVLFLMFEAWFLVPLPKGPLEQFLGF